MIKGPGATVDRYLADLARIGERQLRLEREISSGYRLSKPSDAPDNVINVFELKTSIDRATVINTNLQRVKAEVDSAEAAVRVAVQIVERARVLGAAAASSTAPDRAATASEVRQIHDQLVGLTRTIAEGRFVFSGDRDTEILYQTDWSQPSGMVRPATSATNTRLIEDVNAVRFSISRTAHEIFDVSNPDGTPASGNVFDAVHKLGLALEANDRDATETALAGISAALNHLNRQTTFFGHAQNRVTNAIDLGKKALIARTRELSAAQETDMAEALVNLNMAKVHHEAALGAHARAPRSTLFDYLA